jgi:hypothetical protein
MKPTVYPILPRDVIEGNDPGDEQPDTERDQRDQEVTTALEEIFGDPRPPCP